MKRLLLLLAVSLCGMISHSQLLSWTPPFPVENNTAQTLIFTLDATKGNQGLLNYTSSDVYVHIGVVTNKSTPTALWQHVPFTWATTPVAAKATYIGNNKWTYTITGSLRSFFGVTDATETIQKVGVLFRSGDGTKKQTNIDGSDMFIPVSSTSLDLRLTQPPKQPTYVPVAEPQTWVVGTTFTISADANKPSAMKLYHNGTVIATSAGNVTTLSGSSSVTAVGNQQIVAEANDGTTTKFDTTNVFISPAASPVVALPAGMQDGINYGTGNTSVTLVLRAPGKNIATVIGEFNNWVPTVMNKTPDGKFFWITISGLTAGTEYAYQYMVNNTIKIADPYAEKILDPNNDGAITSATYPNLKPYPAGQSGMVSVLQTAAPAYTWGVNNFIKQDKKGLVIYELLLRDFVATHNWKTLKDTLSYLKRLGINAIEVMPFNEFEGNSSWGYNGFQYFAPDKYYGAKNTIKEFIDTCHKNGIAVIMDIVLNHTYGPSPLRDLYYDQGNNRPAANNPWYNAVAPHAFGFGDDFNHESADTKYFFNRVLQHWITEYRVDGYRVDFSKGLTQKTSTNDGDFSAYDASRIAIIAGYASAIRTVDPNAYIILEHFCANTEEKELSDNNGLLLWANVWTQYQEASMGYVNTSNFDGVTHVNKGWVNPHLVGFMESHDEERVTYKNIKYGATGSGYNVKDTATALKRMELNAAFLLTIPGPKMIYEFGELGYDYSRCYLATNGEGGDCNTKTDPKPIRWDYQNDTRRKSVFNVYSQLNRLRFHPMYTGAFQTGTIDRSLSGAFKWIKVTTASDTADVMVVGNFDVTVQTGSVTFPKAGMWYDYFSNTPYTATGTAQNFTLQPGEYHVFVNRNVNNVVTTPVVTPIIVALTAAIYPNPVRGSYTLKLELPESSSISLDLYNNVGQYITTIYKGSLSAGTKTITMPPLTVPKGIYYVKLQTKKETKTISLTIQ